MEIEGLLALLNTPSFLSDHQYGLKDFKKLNFADYFYELS